MNRQIYQAASSSLGPAHSYPSDLSYEEALESVLGNLDLSVIIEADVGHIPPQMTFINGALAQVRFMKERSQIEQIFME